MSAAVTLTARDMRAAVAALFLSHGLQPRFEYTLPSRRRLDVAAIGRTGRCVGVEIKVSRRDLRRDEKWREYIPYVDLLYFAVPPWIPAAEVPRPAGVIYSDGLSAHLIRRCRWNLSHDEASIYYDPVAIRPHLIVPR